MVFPTPSTIRSLLDELGTKPHKRFGQNFLNDYKVVEKIVKVLDIQPFDNIIEIGPGLGSMTVHIINEGGKVIAVEIDSKLAEHLDYHIRNSCYQSSENFEVWNMDALEMPNFPKNFTKVASNLPYNIATPIIIEYFKHYKFLKVGVFMVQKEIALRLTAKPNDKLYSASTVKLQTICSTENLFDISRKVFTPNPNVDSSIIKVIRTKESCSKITSLFNFIDLSFSHRRKTLANNLKTNFDINEILGALKEENLKEDSRAQELTSTQFENIFGKLTK